MVSVVGGAREVEPASFCKADKEYAIKYMYKCFD